MLTVTTHILIAVTIQLIKDSTNDDGTVKSHDGNISVMAIYLCCHYIIMFVNYFSLLLLTYAISFSISYFYS